MNPRPPLVAACVAWFQARQAAQANPRLFPFDSQWVRAFPGQAYLRYGLRPCYTTHTLPLTLVLANLELDPAARGQGLLRAQLLPAIAALGTQWGQPVVLENVINPRLAAFFHRQGYPTVGPSDSPVPTFQLVGPFP